MKERNLRKTNIVGPAVENRMDELMKAGMSIARINFSHGDFEEQKDKIERFFEIRKELGLPVAVMLDTKGPEIRTALNKAGRDVKVQLKEGQKFTFFYEDRLGDEEGTSLSYKDLYKDVKPGNLILIDDGKIQIRVDEIKDKDIIGTVLNDGGAGSRKSINVPGVSIKIPFLSPKDINDLSNGARVGFDYVSASFVRNKEDVEQVRQLIRENGGNMKIISKIENTQGLENLEEIMEASDGIMVARGDMGVEVAMEEVPVFQKRMIKKSLVQGKIVITATQMLDSMMRNPRPTRAEVTDVANAVYDGTDAVMLSGETAQGKYPLEALQMMVQIVETTEEHLDYDSILVKAGDHLKSGVSSAIGYASVLAAANLNARCIITPSVSGATTRVVSNLRPKQEILGITPNERTLRRMSIYWGVRGLKSLEFHTTDDICSGAIDLAQAKKCVDSGDIVVLTAGIPSPSVQREKGSVSNMMRIATID